MYIDTSSIYTVIGKKCEPYMRSSDFYRLSNNNIHIYVHHTICLKQCTSNSTLIVIPMENNASLNME